MSWTGRLLETHDRDSVRPAEALSDRVDDLIIHQRQNWPLLSDGYRGLAAVKTRRLESPDMPGSYVLVQHNPARIRSTAAAVDRASIESRKCFLCPENLPPEEVGLEYSSEFVVACNPFPVLDRHLSIIHRRHIEQVLDGYVEALVELARDLGSSYLVLYNGPRCGASAPDHLHLQACSRAVLPIEASLGRLHPVRCRAATTEAVNEGGLIVGVLEDFGRNLIVLRGRTTPDLAGAIEQLLINFADATGSDTEPMVNLIVTHERGLWTVYLFPRARHRPASFFAEGDQQIMISPGAIDMAGVIVAPREEDFEKVGAKEALGIFTEVSASKQLVRELAESL